MDAGSYLYFVRGLWLSLEVMMSQWKTYVRPMLATQCNAIACELYRIV